MNYPTTVDRETLTRLEASYAVEPSGCWRWIRTRTTAGYGHFWWRGAYYQAHRFVYSVLRGSVATPSMDHLCRNRWCVNPDHVEPVSVAVNTQRASRADFSPSDVQEIRTRAADGAGIRALARDYGVNHSTISRIVNGLTWKPEPAPSLEVAA